MDAELALARMIDVFGEKAKNISNYEIFVSHRGSVEGRDKTTLIPVLPAGRITFDYQQSETIDELDRLMSLKDLTPEQRVGIYTHLLKKEIRFQVENPEPEEVS